MTDPLTVSGLYMNGIRLRSTKQLRSLIRLLSDIRSEEQDLKYIDACAREISYKRGQ